MSSRPPYTKFNGARVLQRPAAGVVERLLKSDSGNKRRGGLRFLSQYPGAGGQAGMIRNVMAVTITQQPRRDDDYRIKDLKADIVWAVVGEPQRGISNNLRDRTARGFKADFHHIRSAAFSARIAIDENAPRAKMSPRRVAREAIARARKSSSRKSGLERSREDDVAKVIGIGAVKYSDLCSIATDYVFSLERMLSLQGNTARICKTLMSAFADLRKAGETMFWRG